MSLYVNIPFSASAAMAPAPAPALLGDASVTLQPFTDLAGLYIMPPNTMTANRTITLGNTSAPAAGLLWLVTIIRYDRTAFTLTIRRTDLTNIYVDPVSPTSARLFQAYCNAGVWAQNAGWLVSG